MVYGSRVYDSLPIEQAVYDLMVQSDDGIHRVQVKTTTTKSTGNGIVTVSRRPYSVGNLAPRMPFVGNASALLGADADHEPPGVVVPVS
jgi:hypothetical protein